MSPRRDECRTLADEVEPNGVSSDLRPATNQN